MLVGWEISPNMGNMLISIAFSLLEVASADAISAVPLYTSLIQPNTHHVIMRPLHR